MGVATRGDYIIYFHFSSPRDILFDIVSGGFVYLRWNRARASFQGRFQGRGRQELGPVYEKERKGEMEGKARVVRGEGQKEIRFRDATRHRFRKLHTPRDACISSPWYFSFFSFFFVRITTRCTCFPLSLLFLSSSFDRSLLSISIFDERRARGFFFLSRGETRTGCGLFLRDDAKEEGKKF